MRYAVRLDSASEAEEALLAVFKEATVRCCAMTGLGWDYKLAGMSALRIPL